MFLDTMEVFEYFGTIQGLELIWDEGAHHVVVTARLGKPVAPREVIATAISAANTDLGLVGFRLDGEDVIFALAQFIDPDLRVSSAVLQRLIITAREAVKRFMSA